MKGCMTVECQAAHFRHIGILARILCGEWRVSINTLWSDATLCDEWRTGRETTSLQTLGIMVQAGKQIEPNIVNAASEEEIDILEQNKVIQL